MGQKSSEAGFVLIIPIIIGIIISSSIAGVVAYKNNPRIVSEIGSLFKEDKPVINSNQNSDQPIALDFSPKPRSTSQPLSAFQRLLSRALNSSSVSQQINDQKTSQPSLSPSVSVTIPPTPAPATTVPTPTPTSTPAPTSASISNSSQSTPTPTPTPAPTQIPTPTTSTLPISVSTTSVVLTLKKSDASGGSIVGDAFTITNISNGAVGWWLKEDNLTQGSGFYNMAGSLTAGSSETATFAIRYENANGIYSGSATLYYYQIGTSDIPGPKIYYTVTLVD